MSTTADQFRSLRYRPGFKAKKGTWDKVWIGVRGYLGRLTVRPGGLLRRARRIEKKISGYRDWTDERLKNELEEFRCVFRRRRETVAETDSAIAIICEMSRRIMGMQPYKVQIAGGLAIWQGTIAEMATGEGKTLVATIPAILGGWRGDGCHVLTDNAYLAERDADLMRPLYEACGLKVGFLSPEGSPGQRHAAYSQDITYGTSHEVASDYLFDRLDTPRIKTVSQAMLHDMTMKGNRWVMRQRGLPFVIVDEADSVLIDGGTTPLIISGESGAKLDRSVYVVMDSFAKALTKGEHFVIHHADKEIQLTNNGEAVLRELTRKYSSRMPRMSERRIQEMTITALRANHQQELNKHYIIADGKVVVVDQATGRPQPNVQWSDGLHQAVEAKEDLKINLPSQTMAKMSFQRFFNLYGKLGGMTGTARNARSELWSIYGRQVVPIPTNKKCIRKARLTRRFLTIDQKFKAIIKEVGSIHEHGQPVLIGTVTIGCSEDLSQRLRDEGIEHTLLNARHTQHEADIVAQAGRRGAVTIATNMAGRGTDIKLSDEVRALGGLHVIIAEWQASPRSDRQLVGRSSRQGDPGSARAYASIEDGEFQHHVPWAHWGLGSLRLLPGPLRYYPLRFAMSAGQTWAEMKGRRQRQLLMNATDSLEQTLGFAGGE